MTESNFKTDFPKGQQGERFIAEYFQDTLGYKIISFNNTNSHDFIVEKDGKQLSVEVKTDTTVHLGGYVKTDKLTIKRPTIDSGNLFIETKSWNRPSGISVCTADLFVYYYPALKEAWIIKTDKLNKLSQDNNFEIKNKDVGDKGSNTEGYVIPREKFRSHFKVVSINQEWVE